MTSPRLAILTCTGDRPEAFALCERWVRRQTRPPDCWVVADDGRTPARCTAGQRVIRLPPAAGNSLARNLLAGLDAVPAGYAVAFVEDDDWYGPGWLEWCGDALAGCPIAGEGRAVYYHVGRRALTRHANRTHASLCQTAVRAELLPLLRSLCARGCPFVDAPLWGRSGFVPQRLDDAPLVVGVKGMPGRAGTGIGHNPELPQYAADPELTRLRQLIGDDADAYAGFAFDATLARTAHA